MELRSECLQLDGFITCDSLRKILPRKAVVVHEVANFLLVAGFSGGPKCVNSAPWAVQLDNDIEGTKVCQQCSLGRREHFYLPGLHSGINVSVWFEA